MKVLLFGDFSNCHVFLRDGLIKLGHTVDVFSSGDSFKNTPYNIKRKAKLSLFDYKDFILARKLIINYDVIQFVNIKAFGKNILLWLWFFLCGKKYKKKLVMNCVGCDYVFWSVGPKILNIPLFKEICKYDKNRFTNYFYLNIPARLISYIMLSVIDKFVGFNEYYECYKQYSSNYQLTFIPLPITLESYNFTELDFSSKLNIIHGISPGREGFKGSNYILEAFKILNERYSKQLNCQILSGLSFSEYKLRLLRSHVILDQTNCIGWGMNALGGLAMGKIVGCCSQNSIYLDHWLALQGAERPPILSLQPCVKQIISQVEWIINNRNALPGMAFLGRKYIENYHDSNIVAQKAIKAWIA